jgi:hypothetical protein
MQTIQLNFIHRLLMVALALGLMSGCASVHKMSPTRDTQALELKDKALVLMSLQLAHDYKPAFQPDVTDIRLASSDQETMGDEHKFIIDDDSIVRGGGDVTYLLRMQLDPGKYVIRNADATYIAIPIIANCTMPIHEDLEVAANTVTYVGRVRGVTRKREEGEFRSGPLLPLLDQGVSGFAHSTFDVKVSDKQNEDLKAFRNNFPALKSADIQVDILPPFDRQRARNWWEHGSDEDKAATTQESPEK